MSRHFSIISAGPGHSGLLTEDARKAILSAEEVYACGRVAGALAALRADWRLCPAETLAEIASESQKEQVALVISGDACFSVRLSDMVNRLSPLGEVQVYPGVHSMQYLCAKLGERYDDGVWLRDEDSDLLAAVSYHRKLFLTIDSRRGLGALCTELCRNGLGHLHMTVGARLATGRETIAAGTAQTLRGKTFDAPALVLLINEHAADPLRPVFDSDLTAGEGIPMMRQEIRWSAAGLLAVRPDDVVYDLGAGSGAMSMELARQARCGCVYAVDDSVSAIDLITRNRETTGCWNVRVVRGPSITAMKPLPAPDAAFIGRNAGSLREILSALKEKNAQVRVVIAADSLERLSEAQLALSTLRYKNVEVSQLLLSRTRPHGDGSLTAGETMFLLRAGTPR